MNNKIWIKRMKSKNAIANAFFFDFSNGRVVNSVLKNEELYMAFIKNCYVSLFSAKVNNPEDDCVLVTNIDIGDDFRQMFLESGIVVERYEKYSFSFGNKNDWQGAFYKLEVLNYLCTIYENILVVDSDTVFTKSLASLWSKLNESILIYRIEGRHEDPVKTKLTIDTYNSLYCKGANSSIQHWGGEFIAGTKETVKKLYDECVKVNNDIVDSRITVSHRFGQEAIMSIALAKSSLKVDEANEYIARLATGRFYEINKDYKDKNIWHLLSEKDRGLIRIYDYLSKNQKMPNKVTLIKLVHLHRKHNVFEILFLGIRKIILDYRCKV